MSHLFAEAQPPRDNWRVEIVEQRAESGLVLFEYAVREVNKDPFLLNNHKAQIRTNHQRVVIGPSGGMMHVSGVEVLDVEEFEKDARFHRWLDKDRNGNWRDDQGRTLAPFVFASAPWAGGSDEELDPQWQRETFILSEASQVQECIDRYQGRAEEKGYVGDKRGTTLNLQVGASGDDVFERNGTLVAVTSTVWRYGDDGTGACNSAARFLNVTIAQASTINTAVMTLRASSDLSGTTCNVNLSADDQDNAPQITTTAEFDAMVRTVQVAWNNLPAQTAPNDYTTPDITTVVQGIVNRAGWSSGNALNAIADNNASSSSARRQATSYDSSSSTAPKLDIDYTAGGGGPVIPVFMNQYRQRWN